MFDWITDNLATILVSLALLVLLFFVFRSMIKEKKRTAKCGGCMYCNACSKSQLCCDSESSSHSGTDTHEAHNN